LLCEALAHHNFTYMLLDKDVDRKVSLLNLAVRSVSNLFDF
jgi:hypothetical protein